MSRKKAWSLGEIVARLGGKLEGDASLTVSQVASLSSASVGQISFLSHAKHLPQLHATKASAVIISTQLAAETTLSRIVHPNPYAYYARLVALFNPEAAHSEGIHPSAVLSSPVPASAHIGAHVVIGKNVVLGENVRIFPACVIGDDVCIGADSVLYPKVVIYHHCLIGQRAVLHAGAVIGSDGFGFAKDGECWVKIPQIGRVILGDDVEVGANTSIDRGALDDTVIGNDVKLDNQIQIAHNVTIGEHSALAGCVGVAGSTKIGRRCTVGGAGMIIGHLNLADDVHISAGTMVTKDITQAGQYTSIFPLAPHAEWRRNAVQIKRLATLAERISLLEKKLEKLETEE